MTSIHIWKSIDVARRKGAWSGNDNARPLWELSKRELVEAVLHLAACRADPGYDAALESGEAVTEAMTEITNLRAAGMI